MLTEVTSWQPGGLSRNLKIWKTCTKYLFLEKYLLFRDPKNILEHLFNYVNQPNSILSLFIPNSSKILKYPIAAPGLNY